MKVKLHGMLLFLSNILHKKSDILNKQTENILIQKALNQLKTDPKVNNYQKMKN